MATDITRRQQASFLGEVVASQSGTWLINQVNTGGPVILNSTNIVNSAGWVMTTSSQLLSGVALAGSMTALQGTSGPQAWLVTQVNTSGSNVNIVNSAGWVVTISNNLVLASNNALKVAIGDALGTSNLAQVDGTNRLRVAAFIDTQSAVSIINSAGWVTTTSAQLLAGVAAVGSVSVLNPINIVNTAGWTVGVGSTAIVNSAGWIVSVANTQTAINVINSAGWVLTSSSQLLAGVQAVGSVSILNAIQVVNTATNVNIINSAGWLVGVGSTSIVNSAGWIVSVANTQTAINIINSAGWVFAQSNTAGITANVINSAGWVVASTASQAGLWTVQPGNTVNTSAWLVAAAQSGTWTVQPGNVANTSAWLVTAAQSGAWTARVVGNAGATLDSPVGSGTAPTNQLVVGALYNATEISPASGQAFALQADSRGRVRQVIMDAAGNTRGANVTANNSLLVDPSGIVNRTATGTIAANNDAVTLDVQGCGTATIQITGTFSGTVNFQGTVDGTNYVSISAVQTGLGGSLSVGQLSTGVFPGYIGFFQTAGLRNVRAIGAAWVSGSATVTMHVALGSGSPSLATALPTGANVIGALAADQTVNLDQVAGTATTTNEGAAGAGSQRVVLATLASNPSSTQANVSLGQTTGKTNVLKTGSLTTTAVTADQVILTYTVTAGKTFYWEYFLADVQLTTLSGTASILGNMSVETPSGTKVITYRNTNPTSSDTQPTRLYFAEPIPIAAGTVLRVVCTPNATTSMLWQASFGGYEK